MPQVELVVETGRRWLQANGAVLAGHLAFRAFLFMVPLILLVVSGLGFASDSIDVQSEASEKMGLSRALASSIADAGNQARESRAQLGVTAIFAVLLAGWGLLGAFRLVFAFIWGVPAKSHDSVIKLLVRFLGVAVAFMAFNAIRHLIGATGPIGTVAGLVGSFLVNIALMLGLSWLLPRRPTTLVDLLPGSVLSGVALTLLSVGGSWYFTAKLERAAELYGVVGIVVVVLGYLFFTGQAVVLGVVTNTVWLDRDEIMDAVRQAPVVVTDEA